MKKNTEILDGPIIPSLFWLALPVVLTSLVSIAYNLTDTWFIGEYLGDKYVSAVAAGAFFINFGMCFCNISKIGGQILVAQSIGAGKIINARRYVRASIYICIFFGTVYMVFVLLFHDFLIKLLGVKEITTLEGANEFLIASSFGFVFLYGIITVSAILNGEGNTKIPFMFNALGLIMNVILDYIFLKYLKMGIKGAAYATVISQMVSCILICYYLFRKNKRFRKLKLFKIDSVKYYKRIIKLGIPNGVNQALFSVFAIIIGGMISQINEDGLGIQRLGIQFEAFSWNIGIGLSSAVATFVGQNYGAGNIERLKKGYYVGLMWMVSVGSIITFIFMFGGRGLYSLYFDSPERIALGVDYLRILGISQIFMCAEITTTGAFNGVGKTIEPTINSIFMTSLRIPLAYMLTPALGLVGIWWSISGTSILKGMISIIWFLLILRKMTNNKKLEYESTGG